MMEGINSNSNASSTTASVICEEVFDEGYQPSMKEIQEYALKIGVDPEREPNLLYLAKEGLMQALPPDWKICYTDKLDAHYYYNRKTEVSQWDHPLDAIYREKVKNARLKITNYNTITNTIDSSDDISQLDSGIRSLQGNDDSMINSGTETPRTLPLGMNIKENRLPTNQLSSITSLSMTENGTDTTGKDKPTTPILAPTSSLPLKFNKKLPQGRTSRFEVTKTSAQIGLDMRFNIENRNLDTSTVKSNWKPTIGDDRNNTKTGFILSGTGAMFLKSNTKKLMTTSIDRNENNSNDGKPPVPKPIDLTYRRAISEIIPPTVKGILRDTSLTDVRRKYEDGDHEDKKSVRFNLVDIKLRSNYSPDEENSSSKKFGSPDVSENSENDNNINDVDEVGVEQNDDDPWDFMENDPETEEKHVKEIKLTPAMAISIPIMPIAPVISLAPITTVSAKEPQSKISVLKHNADSLQTLSNGNKLESIDWLKTFSRPEETIDRIGSVPILEKNNENNLVRPLYEDTDSDSRGSSVTSFIQKTSNEQNLIVDEIDGMATRVDPIMEHNEQLNELRERLRAEREAEESKLREELRHHLDEKRKQFIKPISESDHHDPKECDTVVVDVATIVQDMKKSISADVQNAIEKYKAENEVKLKEIIEIGKQKFEKELEVEEEKLKGQHDENIEKVREEYREILESVKRTYEEEQNKELEDFKCSIQKEFDSRRQKILDEHKSAVDILQRNHAEIVQDLERDLKSEEEILKKEHTISLAQMRDKLSHEMEMEKHRMRESGEDRLYEKIRCEKRLLEDKYRCLKEKYIRLKTDVKLSLERRNKRREQQQQQQQQQIQQHTPPTPQQQPQPPLQPIIQSPQLQQQSLTATLTNTTTTGSETERSSSNQKASIGNSDNRSLSLSGNYMEHGKPPLTPTNQTIIKERLHGKPTNERQQSRDRKMGIASKYIKQLQAQYNEDTTSVSQSDTTISNNYTKGRYMPSPYNNSSENGNSDTEAFCRNQENNNNPRDRQRKKLFTRMKSASTSRLNSEHFKDDRPCTPVENLRRQLQKLEDLEDQFPDNTLDTTYHLRYPFSDVSNDHGGTSSELEFFKHRIHLERDSVRRAKESLRMQRTNFRARQREIKQRHKSISTRHTLDQLIQEEKELTEMEVNLHRTRALLGEKVIRLRHLEQSLQRICEKERPMDLLNVVENKDDATLSDLSSHSSSGFSSTDFASDTNQANVNRRKEMYQESSECIQNLEILNAEIREILDLLSKPQSNGVPAVPQLGGHQDLNWTMITSASQQATNNSGAFMHAPQSIPTLADRLETYRQLAAGRVQTSVGGALIAANTIVSQSPRAVNYTTSLVERTRDLRNWLRQAKNEHEILSSTSVNIVGGNAVGGGTGQQANL